MRKASEVRRIALSHVGKPYGWGEEGRYVVGTETTAIDDVDCSGEIYATFREAGVLYKGKTLWRGTANDFWKLVTKRLSQPERIGDCCWFPKTGEKKHIALYLGDDTVIEAGYHGPNNAYPGAHYVGTCTVAQMNARGAVWGRIEGLDIYDEEEDMTADEVRAIVREEMEMVWSSTVDRDQKYLVTKGIVEKARPKGKLATVSYVDSLLARVLKKALGE